MGIVPCSDISTRVRSEVVDAWTTIPSDNDRHNTDDNDSRKAQVTFYITGWYVARRVGETAPAIDKNGSRFATYRVQSLCGWYASGPAILRTATGQRGAKTPKAAHCDGRPRLGWQGGWRKSVVGIVPVANVLILLVILAVHDVHPRPLEFVGVGVVLNLHESQVVLADDGTHAIAQ